ncbi:MAG: autotransporter-associated beta strand repeat-containing protein, partial [Alphaproteobacteria bacterium]|nr:autotransporter-associated beta strand repeat-containing protein [Alphaproteobacteria bacterium]
MSGLFIAGNEADAESTITISDGGTLRAVQGTLGNLAGSNATMTVTGAGSTWSAYDDGVTAWAGFMNVGLFGSSTLNVTDGGTVEAVRLYVGNDVGSTGTVLLSGEGSTVRTQQGLYIGAEGAGTLTLTDGAHIEAEAIKVGYLSGSTGTLNIGAATGETAATAGTIDAGEIVLGSGESLLVLNHIHSDYEIAANFTGTGDVDVLAGTTLLSGDNSAFAGGFSIEGGKLILASVTNAVSTTVGTEGTLQIGNGGTSGSLNGDIVNNGSLVFDRSDALHHNRVISGTGDLTIAGGIITLSGMNTFTGATTIDTGATLALSNQGRVNQSSLVTVNGTFDVTEGSAPRINDIAGSGTVLLGDPGIQIDNASHVFSGQITGSGGLYVNAGTLTLTGENDFASGLGIGDATVRIGDGGTTGSITASTLNYGTLIFDRSNEWTYAGAITGRGEIVHTGSGTTNLTGGLSGNHLIVENGTVNQIGGLVALFGEGAGIVVEGDHAQLNVTNVGARATNTVYLVRDGGSLAINGGSIRVGSSEGSAGVHLQSGNAWVTGTTFTVGSANTYGVVVDAGNTLTVADSTITTTGQAAIGALARDGGALAISGTTIETEGTDAYAAYASNGGTITLANSTIATSGLVADALVSDGNGSLISATDTTIETTGIQTAAVVARNSGAVDLTGGSVSATVNAENPAAVWALLAKDGGSISATNVDLSLTMLDSSPYVTGVAYAMDEGSSITITGGTATASGKRANGIFAYNSGSVSAQGLTISTSGEQARGVYANADSNAAGSVTLADVTINASGTSAHGLFAKRDGGSTGNQIATITGENVALAVEGDQANGVYAAVGGIITLNGGSVSTSGLEGHALHAQQFDGGMTGGGVITASGLTVTTSGASAFGGLAEAGGLLSLTDSSVTTSGEDSYGLYARTNGALVVSNASIVSGAIGMGIANAGSIDMTGGDIESAGASLEASTSDDVTATFRFSGTDLTKNNGTLLAVAHQSDGDGSGAASLSLLDGSAAKGSIIGIGDGQLDVLVSESSLEGAISNVSRLTLDGALWTVTALQGLGELNIASGSTTINTATTITHDGALTGSGTLIKSGTGRFALAGDGSDFAGTTRIDAGSVLLTGSLDGAVTINAQGTMIVGDGVTNGDLTASTVNDGTLIFNQIGDYDYTGALSGNGGLVKQGSGTLLLSGDYGYTGSTIVEAGKVRLLAELDSDTDLVVNDGEFDLSGTDQTVAGLSGTGGTVNIGTSTLTVNQGASTTFGGVFTGGGQIVLQSPVFDPGAPVIFHLTGASVDFTGGIDLHSVQVRVNGSMGGSIFVGNNAALGGSGQTNDIVVGSGGTLLPGNSIGTLTAEGNVIFEAGSAYEVE